jgi:hypothetical protein
MCVIRNDGVGGSNPSCGTNKISGLLIFSGNEKNACPLCVRIVGINDGNWCDSCAHAVDIFYLVRDAEFGLDNIAVCSALMSFANKHKDWGVTFPRATARSSPHHGQPGAPRIVKQVVRENIGPQKAFEVL